MTDMQMLDDAGSIVPKTNEIDLFEDWKLLGDYSLDNAFIPTFLAITTVLFGVAGVVAWCIDKQVEISVDALEERMYLLGGDVTIDPQEEAKTKASFVFDVYPEIYWEPLAIASNNSILVEESTSIAITRYDLQVESRQEMLPKDIIYTVISFFYLFQNTYFTSKSKKMLANDDRGKRKFQLCFRCQQTFLLIRDSEFMIS